MATIRALLSAFLLFCVAAFDAHPVDASPKTIIAPLDTSLADAPSTITGTVQNTADEPLAGVPIRLWEQERPEGLRDTTGTPAAVTDAAGAFQLDVPSRHVRNYIEVSHAGYEPVQEKFFQSSPPIHFQLVSLPVGDVIFGTVTRDDQPARATVHLLPGGGLPPQRVETDGEGKFTFPATTRSQKYPVFYAESDGRFSPLGLPTSREGGANLKLGAPGSLAGRLVAQDTEEPIAGCVVEITSETGSPIGPTRVTDSNGHFLADTLPPGAYKLNYLHEGYGEIKSPTGNPTFRVSAGQKTDYLGTLTPKRILTGTVVSKDGHPVVGAWVGFTAKISTSRVGRRAATPAAPVQTDTQGHFELRTLTQDSGATVQAYHAAHGWGESRLAASQPGEERPTHITLGGAIRVHGTVLNKKGGPIANVMLGEVETDERGHFDSGFAKVPLSETGTVKFSFVAPRPNNGSPVPGALSSQTSLSESFYLHRSVDLAVESGQDITLEVTLQPTRAITFSGRVTDPGGKAIPGTQLSLTYGDRDDRRARPLRLRPGHSLFTSLRLNGGMWKEPPFNGAITDETGHWALVLPVETSESWRVAYGGNFRPSGAVLHADHPTRGETTNLSFYNLDILPDQNDVDLNFSPLSASTEDYRHIRVVDSEGKPLEKILWTWGGRANGPTMRSDAAGKLAVKFDERHKTIVLVDKGWSVVSPVNGGWGIRESMLVKSEDGTYRIVLGTPGHFSVHVRYPDGVSADADGGDKLRHGKTRYTADPGHFVIENMKAGKQTVVVKANYGYQKEFDVHVPAAGRGELLVEVPRPTCTLQGQLQDEQGNTQTDVRILLTGDDVFTYEHPAEDGSFSFDVVPGDYAVDVTRKNMPCLLNSYRETVAVGPEDTSLALDLLVTTPAVIEGASNLGRLGKLIIEATSQSGVPEVGLLMSAVQHRNGTMKMTGQTDQSGYHIFERVSTGLYTLNFSLGGYLGEAWEYLIPIEEGATRRCEIRLDEGAGVTGSVVGPTNPSHMKIKLVNRRQGITCTVRPHTSGHFQFTTFPKGPAQLHYLYDSMGIREFLPVVVGEDMQPIEIIIPGGRISGSLPRTLATLGQRGHIEVWNVGKDGDQWKCSYDGLNFLAEFLEDGDYEVRFVLDRKTIAVSKTLTIQDGATMENVALEVDPKTLLTNVQKMLLPELTVR